MKIIRIFEELNLLKDENVSLKTELNKLKKEVQNIQNSMKESEVHASKKRLFSSFFKREIANETSCASSTQAKSAKKPTKTENNRHCESKIDINQVTRQTLQQNHKESELENKIEHDLRMYAKSSRKKIPDIGEELVCASVIQMILDKQSKLEQEMENNANMITMVHNNHNDLREHVEKCKQEMHTIREETHTIREEIKTIPKSQDVAVIMRSVLNEYTTH